MKKFITIFPYVYINVQNDDALFYNTLSGNSSIFAKTESVAQVAKTLLENNYACLVEEKQIKNLELRNFFTILLENNFGFSIDEEKLSALPFTTQSIDINDKRLVADFKNNETLLENLREITLFLNNSTNAKSHFLSNAHHQFLYPIFSKEEKELGISNIRSFLKEIEGNPLNINIVGGNILAYSDFKELVDDLNSSWHNVFYYFHYLDLVYPINKDKLSAINDKATKVLLVDFPLKQDELEKWEDILRRDGVKVKFIVENESQIAGAEAVISKFNITNYMFRPYYNGKNIDFFEENVFVNEEDIRGIKEDLFTLVTKKISNPSFFGKLKINTDGRIFTNFNSSAIGNIKESNIKKIIFDLLEDENSSWRVNKIVVDPCRNCIYNILCPPISNYESVLGRNNLCNFNV